MINKISSRLLMLLVLLVVQVSVAFAQVKITMDDLDIYAGEEQTVAVSMENAGEEKLIALQFELTLPEGLSIKDADKEGSEALSRIHFVQYQKNTNKEGNVYTVVIASSYNTAFKTNVGKLFNLKVKAAAGYLGAGTIKIGSVEGSDTNREPVAGEGGTAASIAATFGAETTAFETYPTQEFEVNITLDNSTVFRDFQFNLTLPKGLELVEGEDGFFGYTDRIPADAALAPQLNGNYYKVACVSPSAGLVDDGKGKFFSFKVKATTELAAEASIVLDNFVISDRNANAYELDDEVVVKVSNLNEPAKVEADSVVAALQTEYDLVMVKIAADCKDVVESEAVAAEADSVQKLIADLQAAVDAAYAAGTLSELDNAEAVKGIADATSKMLENATAAQKAFDEAVAANAAQYAADTLAVDAAQVALDAVKAEIEGYDESVKAAVADAIAAAQAAVDAAQAAADKSFAAGTSVADAAANAELVAAANAAAEKLAADAAAAQKEFEESQSGPTTKPEAPELTATSALVTDGSVAQYLYNVEAKAFLIGGNDWGTRASYSATNGYPVKLTLNEDGATYTFNDQLPNGNWNSLDCQGVDQIWVDGAGRGGDKMWTVTVAEDGSFTIANSNVPNGNLSVVPSKAGDTRLYISDAEEAQDVWVAVSEEEYKAYIEKYSKYQSDLDEYNKKFYEVGDDITFIVPATWEGQSGSYGGLANPAAERYNGGGSVEAGDVLTQTVTGLKNGTYEVTLGLAASYTSGRGFECPTGDGLSVGFANEAEAGITVVETGWVSEGQQAVVTLTATVTDGTLKYGIKNLAPSGNWYVAQVVSIVYAAEPVVPIHTIDFTTQTSYPYYNMGAPEGSSFDVIDGALVIENTAERTNPWDLQPFICDWFSLKAGYDYVVRITMKASADGSTQLNMGTWSAAMYQQLAFTASEEYKTYDVAFPNSTVESSGNDVHVLFQGGKYIGKVEIAKVEIFEYAPEPEPTEATYTIDVERYPGLGYGVTTFTPDFTEALAFLGIEDVTAATLVGINADGSEEAAPGPGGIDGWCNAEGTFVGWGDNSKICVKFFPSVPQYEICDMNGADVVGTTYTVKYAIKANDKTAIFAINVKFVEKPVVALTYADLTNKKDVAVELTSELGMVYEGLAADVDVAAILAELGAESLNDVTVYAVQSDGTLDDNYKLGTTDGWRNADGDWQSWGADAFLCVKADFSLEAGQIYYVGGMDGNTTEPGAYTATYAFVNEAKEAVTLKVTLTYPAAPDAWFTEGMFKVNDYVDGMKMAVADPRYVVDPTDASNGCIIVTSNDAPANDYDAQLFISTAEPLNEGDVFTLTMKVRADREQSGAATQSHTAPGSYIHWDAVGQISFTTEWVEFTKTVTVNSSMATMNTIAINLSDMTGKAANNFYFDDIKLEVAVPDAIEDVEIAAPANGKFIENGQVVIIKNGVKYSVSGSIIR
ncbi:MAG: DUF4859 domain-containing protein [Bacteroidaceae bacterium]|nr:DUF4859 domain-containing protein [Bacteroidaceae bacterium]